jgi:hypothetical protein
VTAGTAVVLALLGAALGAVFTVYGHQAGLTRRQRWQLGLVLAVVVGLWSAGLTLMVALTSPEEFSPEENMIDVVALVLTLAGFATAGYGVQLVRGGARPPWLRRRLGQVAYAAAWLLFAATVAAMLADAALLAAAAGLSAGVCALTRQAIVRGAPLPPGRAAVRGVGGSHHRRWLSSQRRAARRG